MVTDLVGNLIMMNLNNILIKQTYQQPLGSPPNGQRQRQEYRDSVDEITKINMEQHEVAPAFRELR